MIKNIFKISTTFILLFSMMFIAGCNNNKDKLNGEGQENRTLTITMIARSTNDPISLSEKQGAEKHAEKLSNKHQKLDVVIDWKAPESEDANAQLVLIKNAINNKADAIIISCSDANIPIDEINAAEAAGIPVITIDSDAPGSKRTAYYGADHVKTGKDLVHKMADLLGEKGTIAVLAGNKNTFNQQERLRGIRETLKDYPDMSVIEVAYHQETAGPTQEEIKRILNDNPGLDGLLMLGSWAFYNDILLENTFSENLKIVTVDALPSQFPFIEKGIVQACVAQPVFKLGGGAVDLIVDKLYLEKNINMINTLGVIPVSIDNLGGWARQSRAWGFEGILEKYLIM